MERAGVMSGCHCPRSSQAVWKSLQWPISLNRPQRHVGLQFVSGGPSNQSMHPTNGCIFFVPGSGLAPFVSLITPITLQLVGYLMLLPWPHPSPAYALAGD